MKSTSGWKQYGNGTNESGFSGLPGGLRNGSGTFDTIGENGFWWSTSEGGTDDAWYRYLDYYNGNVGRGNYDKRNGFSVRCLRD